MGMTIHCIASTYMVEGMDNNAPLSVPFYTLLLLLTLGLKDMKASIIIGDRAHIKGASHKK